MPKNQLSICFDFVSEKINICTCPNKHKTISIVSYDLI